jgi:hypothetical protein
MAVPRIGSVEPASERPPSGAVMLASGSAARHVGTPGTARVAMAAYVAATLLGVTMRMDLAGVSSGFAFDHLLHAHSHTLYFGWGALGLLALALRGTDPPAGWFRLAVLGAVAVVPALFLGFLATGYHPVTIAISTVAMLVWYAVGVGWWRRLHAVEPTARLAQRYGIVYLFGSSLGVWALAAIQARGGSALAETLAIHAFLIGFGWFLVLMVVGAVLQRADRTGWAVEHRTVRRAIHWWAAVAWVSFPLGVAGGPEVWGLGPLARIAGLVLLVPGVWWVRTLWRAASRRPDGILLRASAAWFGLTMVTTAAVGLVGTPAITFGGRQGVVIHLHALFLGFLTPLLALLLSRNSIRTPLLAHHAGLVVMLSGLSVVAVGLHAVGAWVALAGAAAVWMAGVRWAWPVLWRRS